MITKLVTLLVPLLLLFLLPSSILHANPLLGTYDDQFTGGWTSGTYEIIQYKIYASGKVSRNKLVPIVVNLHGSGEVGKDNLKQIRVPGAAKFVRNFKKRPCILIAPQCPPGNSWMGTAGDAVLALIDDVLKEVAVADRSRVYLTGFSLGGLGTWHFLAKRPDLFAAAMPVAGAGNADHAKLFRGVDIWIFHGNLDKHVPVKHGQAMAAALKKAAIPHQYTEFPDKSHFLQLTVYSREDVHQWLFQQKRE
jgi:predicted peptidase